jgi:hypothetical protein
MFVSSASNSVFSKNVASGGSSSFPTGDSRNSTVISMYKKLSIYINSIRVIFQQYTAGNFYEVANILTQSVYNRYAVELNNLSANPNKYGEYETLRISCVNSLHGMYQGIQQYALMIDLQNSLELSQDHEAILYDPVRLNAYIEELNKPKLALPDSNVTTIAATLKPEYAEYIALHGYPEGGVFDMDKLAAILKQQMFLL